MADCLVGAHLVSGLVMCAVCAVRLAVHVMSWVGWSIRKTLASMMSQTRISPVASIPPNLESKSVVQFPLVFGLRSPQIGGGIKKVQI